MVFINPFSGVGSNSVGGYGSNTNSKSAAYAGQDMKSAQMPHQPIPHNTIQYHPSLNVIHKSTMFEGRPRRLRV